MSVLIKKDRQTLTAYLKGEIDHHSAPELRDAIDDALLDAEELRLLVLDFSGITFMDSSGVGLVMGRYRLACTKKVKLRVTNLSARDYRIMQMSGIEKIAEVTARAEAKEAGK